MEKIPVSDVRDMTPLKYQITILLARNKLSELEKRKWREKTGEKYNPDILVKLGFDLEDG